MRLSLHSVAFRPLPLGCIQSSTNYRFLRAPSEGLWHLCGSLTQGKPMTLSLAMSVLLESKRRESFSTDRKQENSIRDLCEVTST